MSQLYEGLSNKAKIYIISTASLIAVINLFFSWYIAHKTLDDMQISPENIEQIKNLSSNLDISDTYKLMLSSQTISTNVHLKVITNKHTIIVLAITTGFTFIAMGFALFLIGVDGALKIFHEQKDSKLFISITAPGLVSFILATILIMYAISKEQKLKTGGLGQKITKSTDHKTQVKDTNITSLPSRKG